MSIQKLNQMIDSGKTFNYRNQPAVIKAFYTIHDEITVKVEINGEIQDFVKESEQKLGLFLDCFTETAVTPANVNLPAQNGKEHTDKLPLIYVDTKETFKRLTNTLLSDIEKVRTNPEYIGQAKQVCNNISAIVNITKLQLQLLQEG